MRGEDATARVIAVGGPQTFRGQVAWALQADLEEIQWVPSVTAAEEFLAAGPGSPDVVVMSPGIKEVDALGLAQFVQRTAPATAVVMVTERGILNGMLPEAMRAGIRDVVDLSKGSTELREALERAMSWVANLRSVGGEPRPQAPARRGTAISIFSSKGGTGKTFLAANLATAIAERSKQDTAVVDLDLELGDVFSYFGEESKQTTQDLLSLGDLTDRDSILGAGTRLGEHLWGYGVPSEVGTEGVSGEAVGKMLRALRGAFPYVVADVSASYSDHSLAAFDLSDAVFLITGLDIVGVRHLSLALRTLLRLGLPPERFRVVLNRADSKVGLDPREVERVMRIRVDAMIPSSRLVPMSLNRGRPVYLQEPRSAVAKSLAALADRVIAMASAGARSSSPEPAKRGLFSKR